MLSCGSDAARYFSPILDSQQEPLQVPSQGIRRGHSPGQQSHGRAAQSESDSSRFSALLQGISLISSKMDGEIAITQIAEAA